MNMKTSFRCVLMLGFAAVAVVLGGCASHFNPGPDLEPSAWSLPGTTVDARSEPAPSPTSPPSRDTQGEPRAGKARKKVHSAVFGFFEDVELGEIKDEDDEKIHDVSRKRVGLGVAFGSEEIRGQFRVFYEDFGDNVFEDSFDGGGVGGGVNGIPKLADLSEHVKLILPFQASVDIVYGKSEVDVEIIPPPPNPPVYGSVDVDMLYFGFGGHVGLGVDIYGFQPSAGLTLDALYGVMKIDDTVDQYLIDDDWRFDGVNVGGFAELRYKHPDFPVFACVRGLFGDVEGFVVSLGADF